MACLSWTAATFRSRGRSRWGSSASTAEHWANGPTARRGCFWAKRVTRDTTVEPAVGICRRNCLRRSIRSGAEWGARRTWSFTPSGAGSAQMVAEGGAAANATRSLAGRVTRDLDGTPSCWIRWRSVTVVLCGSAARHAGVAAAPDDGGAGVEWPRRQPSRLRLSAGEPEAQAVSAVAAAVPVEECNGRRSRGEQRPAGSGTSPACGGCGARRAAGSEIWLVLRRHVAAGR